jgi:hypothetical protein
VTNTPAFSGTPGFICSEIRHLFLTTFDPLGIGDNPQLQDEYESFIPRLVLLCRRPSLSVRDCRNALQSICDALEVDPDEDSLSSAAEALFRIASKNQDS